MLKIKWFSCLILWLLMPSVFAEQLPADFFGGTPSSSLTLDFLPVDELLDANVLDMGPSKRSFSKSKQAKIGTRIKNRAKPSSGNEGNRFSYELLESDDMKQKVASIQHYVQSLVLHTPLSKFNHEQQLAFWLNLYNVSIINEILRFYPNNNLKPLLVGRESILNKKLINVRGVELTLNDIHHRILSKQFNAEPLIIYGLYQGNIGGPNILNQAFTGENVYRLLKRNAKEFINSNRGVMKTFNSKVTISEFYSRNKDYFTNFNVAIKAHLLRYSDSVITPYILNTEEFTPDITNWQVSDLYGSMRATGAGISTNTAALIGASSNPDLLTEATENVRWAKMHVLRLQALLKVRAQNMGGTSVTISEVEEEAPSPEKIETPQKQP